MNERIRALAEAAGAKYFKDVAVVADRGASGNATDFIPKFAELIVRECMQLNRDILCEDDPNYLDQIYREHFGVK